MVTGAVLAFGDSHVAGCELSDKYSMQDFLSGSVSLTVIDEHTKPLAFSQIVASQLGRPCFNYAMSGGSNARSIRKLVKAVDEHPNSLVLFGYTSTDRSEFYAPDATTPNKDEDGFVQVGMQWTGMKFRDPINDVYLRILRPFNNLGSIASIVESVAIARNCQVVHIPIFDEVFPLNDNVLQFPYGNCYLTWARMAGFTQLQHYHYGIDAHRAVAKMIIDMLHNMEWIEQWRSSGL